MAERFRGVTSIDGVETETQEYAKSKERLEHKMIKALSLEQMQEEYRRRFPLGPPELPERFRHKHQWVLGHMEPLTGATAFWVCECGEAKVVEYACPRDGEV